MICQIRTTKTNLIAAYSLLVNGRCHRAPHMCLISMQNCKSKKKLTLTTYVTASLCHSWLSITIFFVGIFASLQIVKLKTWIIQYNFRGWWWKKSKTSASTKPYYSTTVPAACTCSLRWMKWSRAKHQRTVFTGGVRWRRYRHSIKFVYSLHEYEYERTEAGVRDSHTNKTKPNTISTGRNLHCTTWDFRLVSFFFFASLAQKKKAAPIPPDQIVIHNHVSIHNRRWSSAFLVQMKF